jgi:hypothetical protein
MSNRIENFIHEHREEFDDEIPGSKTWENIKQSLEPATYKKTPIIHFFSLKWAVAAAVILLLGGGIIFLVKKSGEVNPALANADKNQLSGNKLPKTQPLSTDTASTRLAQSDVEPKKGINKEEAAADEQVSDYKEEMYHFAKLVEIRHKELGKLVKDEPLLYRQFASEVNKLDSVYRSLEKQLPQNPNREQLIEAMIQNLQLQMDLLNHQLAIVKQINHSKKSAYEKAFKSA